MGSKHHTKMPVVDRAKQFMPFSAVRGLTEALRKKEQEMMLSDRPEPSEEQAQEVNRCLTTLEKGSVICLLYFHAGMLKRISGPISAADSTARYIKVDGVQIPFDNIVEIAPLAVAQEKP